MIFLNLCGLLSLLTLAYSQQAQEQFNPPPLNPVPNSVRQNLNQPVDANLHQNANQPLAANPLDNDNGVVVPPPKPVPVGVVNAKKEPKTFFQKGQGEPQPPGKFKDDGVHLKDMTECKNDIQKYCKKLYVDGEPTDMDVLECLQDIGEIEGQELSSLCEHTVWKHKINMTRDVRFRNAAESFCKNELARLPDCQAEKNIPGHLLSCLLDYTLNFTKGSHCRRFLTRTAKVAFTDFRLVSGFVDKCERFISQAECGSLPSLDQAPDNDHPHSQGTTLECLLERMMDQKQPKMNVSPDCHKELLRLAELRSDDFHLDRPLYFACRRDRETFCADVQAGDGKVFECLLQHKGHRNMDFKCTEKLESRAELMGQNYKLDHPLTNACKEDIRINNCAPSGDNEPPEHWYVSYVLLCLENAAHSSQPIQSQCKNEMFSHRKLLLSDYHMSPEVVLSCAQDIENLCSNVLEGRGKTLACLMGHARNPRVRQSVTDHCQQALRTLVKAADPGADYRVDPILVDSCKALIEGECQRQTGSEVEVMSCLLNHINAPGMTEDCESHLMEIQYFVSRDWGLDPKLYRACHSDAVKYCHAKQNWHKIDQGPDPGPLVFSCLYRRTYLETEEVPAGENPLSKECKHQVERVLRERAVSVNLLPALEDPCRSFLGRYCLEKTEAGEELACLQEKMSIAKEEDVDCYEAINEFTQIQSKDILLDKALTKSCRPSIQKHCKQLMSEQMDNGDVVQCLILNKDDAEMGHRCREYVRHYELVLMKNYKFSPRFVEACKGDIKLHCTEFATDKSQMVRCLSQVHFEAVVLGKKEEDLVPECRRQLRTEFKVREKVAVEADVQLFSICKVDIKSKCTLDENASVETVTQCLRIFRRELEPACRKFIFGKQKVEMQDVRLDTAFLKACHNEIEEFCPKLEPQDLRKCLRRHHKDPNFGAVCYDMLKERMHEQAEDIRLRPSLFKACKVDMKSACPKESEMLNDPNHKDELLMGQVIECLRTHLTSKDAAQNLRISTPCQLELKHLILESEYDFKMDVAFYEACKSVAERHCNEDIYLKFRGHGYIVECVKSVYYEGRIQDKNCKKEMERRVSEELTDISLDPVLHEACSEDINHYCKETPPGDGRLIQCLVSASESTNVRLTQNCRLKLTDRKRLWDVAAKGGVAIPENLAEFSELVMQSPAKHTFLTFLFVFILMIFVGGLCFGRITKRVSAQIKNK